jgi:hypothetical protein
VRAARCGRPATSRSRTDQRACPQADPLGPEVRVEHFQHDAAHVLVDEEILAGEPKVIQDALHVEEEGIAAPAREEGVIAGLCYSCFGARRNWCTLDDNLTAIPHPCGLRAHDAPQCPGLHPALNGGEAHSVCVISNCIPVRINLELVQRLGCERLGGGSSPGDSRQQKGGSS